ncbi:MFS transporter [uncultured Thermanaerothrix sp.]|uniref:MFS transporter n=1 Tax=uncultured Thermanaerothrix sp. TaxID=1195149 RepID=UPI00263605BF|nr:MFS transporter [uncultured Thermanaerothrix sp.]
MNRDPLSPAPRANPWRYALGEFGLSLPGFAIGTYLVFFYSDVLALPVTLVAIARAINSVWDGFNDPIFAHLSDRTRTRWGRRRPWLWLVLPLNLIAWLALWAPPRQADVQTLFIWFLVFLLFSETVATISWVNYNALFPRLFTTEAQRVRANAIRKALGQVALIGGIALSPLLYSRWGFAGMGAVWAVIGSLAFLLFLLDFREDGETSSAEPMPNFLHNVWGLLKNFSYRLYLGIYMLSTLTNGLLMAGMPFYAKYSLGLAEGQTSLLFGAVFVTAIPGVALWIYITRRLRAARAWQLALAWLMLALLPLIAVRSLWGSLLTAAVIGLGLSGGMVLGDVVLGQIIDEDAHRHGRPREAMFYGLASVLARLSGLLNAQSFVLLTWLFGYVSGEQPGPDPDAAFRFFMVVIPGIALLLAVGMAGWLRRSLGETQPEVMTPTGPTE